MAKQRNRPKVDVWCDFCKETHTIYREIYRANIAKNGTYICAKHQGHIVGSRPKTKIDNPYVEDGRKQCNECKEIKLFEEFAPDKTKSDGRSTKCKKCRAKKSFDKYHSDKSKDS